MSSSNEFGAAENYFHKLLGPEPEPRFESTEELEKYWGRRWGAKDDLAQLRVVLVREPNPGMADIRADAWDEGAQALVDPDKNWYYKRHTPPDMDVVMAQHAGLRQALTDEGVEVIVAPELPRTFTKSVYARDPLLTVPGGAVIGRLAPRMRRGEEASMAKIVSDLGMPILGTITGSGMVEGGSFVKLRPDLALYGTSVRCNIEGASQLSNILSNVGIELVTVPLPGYTIHIDGQFLVLDENTVMANVHRLPYELIARLESMGIEIIAPHPDEQNSCNSLMLHPGRLLMASIYPHTAEMLSRRGFEIVMIDYDEIIHNGGNIHCSTMELVRDW